MKKYVVSGPASSVWCQPHYLTWLHMMCTPYSARDILPLASGVRYVPLPHVACLALPAQWGGRVEETQAVALLGRLTEKDGHTYSCARDNPARAPAGAVCDCVSRHVPT